MPPQYDEEIGIRYRRNTSNKLITWNMLWCNNALFSKFKAHNTLITTSHLKISHGGEMLMDLPSILKDGYVILDKIKKSNSKRKGRNFQMLEDKIKSQDKLAKNILLTFDFH